MTEERAFKVLEEGTALLVALSDRSKSYPYAELEAKQFPRGVPPGTSRWERVHLGPPKGSKNKDANAPEQAVLIPEEGGLWLKLKGLERCELVCSSILMPEGLQEKTAQSLNHALTLLSRAYETHRISNTGNVYVRVFYQDRDEFWYPLDDLRRGVQVNAERSLLNELWQQVEQVLGWRPIPAPSNKQRKRS